MISFLSSILLLAPRCVPTQDPPQVHKQPLVSVEAVDAMLQRGAGWLRGRQREDGAFAHTGDRDVCDVAISAMAMWSLCEGEPRFLDATGAERAGRYLISNTREDGGIYDPARGLAVYTSGVSARALRTQGKRDDWPELSKALAAAELFNYHHMAPESYVDSTKAGEVPAARSAAIAGKLLQDTPPAQAGQRKALEFLSQSTQNPLRPPARTRALNPSHSAS